MTRFGLSALFAFLLLPMAAAAQPEDRNGNALDPKFEGQIAYFGNYTGKTTVLADRDDRLQPHNCPYRDHRCYEQTVGGGVKVVLTFSGEHVSGFYLAVDGFRGPNGLLAGTLVGRRTPIGCELFQSDGTVWRGTCNKREFRGDIGSVPGIPKSAKLEYSAVGMFVYDLGEIEEAKRAIEDYKYRVATLEDIAGNPNADPASLIGAVVQLDGFTEFPYQGVDRVSFPNAPVRWKGGLFGRSKSINLSGRYTTLTGAQGNVTVSVAVSGNTGRVTCIWWGGYATAGCPAPRPAPAPPPLPEEPVDNDWLSNSPAPIIPRK